MIVKVKYETDKPSIFVVENPVYQDTPQVEMFAKFKIWSIFKLFKHFPRNYIFKLEWVGEGGQKNFNFT